MEIARIYLEIGIPSRALERIRKAVEQAPERYYPWYVQGQVESELGLEAAAIRSWQRCLELCPNHSDASEGIVQLEQGGWSFSRTWRRLFGGR